MGSTAVRAMASLESMARFVGHTNANGLWQKVYPQGVYPQNEKVHKPLLAISYTL